MVILGLGGNKGDRKAYLDRAVALLADAVTDMRLSPVYETPAMLPEGAPAEWDVPFLNMAVAGETSLSPRELLITAKAIEKKLGRVAGEKWGPREIDIDILAMDDVVIDEPDFSVPHKGLLDRDFALLPLADIAPEWIYPYGVYSGWKSADIARVQFPQRRKSNHG